MPISRIGTDGIENGAVAPADLSTGGPSWDGSGNVGIGTTSPSSYTSGDQLVIASASGNGQMSLAGADNGNPTINFRRVSTPSTQRGYIQYDNTAEWMRFATNGGERMRISSGGNVGVGTSDNDLASGAGAGVTTKISATNGSGYAATNVNTGTSAYSVFQLGNSIAVNRAGFALTGSAYTANSLVRQDGVYLYTSSPGGMTLNVESAQPLYFGTSNVERLRIEADGDQTFFRALKFYGEKRIQFTSSAFNNPTISLVSFAVTPQAGAYPQIIVKVTVFQTGWSTNVGNIHNGYATTSYNDTTAWGGATANAMVVEANLGTANVGTIAWSTSGNTRTLSYTTNRATNFDSYVIKVEIATSVQSANFDVTFLS